MSRFTIGIVNYGRDPHVRCFEDFARALSSALKALGHEVIPPTDPKPGRLIIFGGNNLIDEHGQMPKDSIIYNTEQLAAVADPSYFLRNFRQYRDFMIWDYSKSNISALHKLGLKNTIFCPVGYISSMTQIKPAADQDIDVLHYGSVGKSPRKEILDALDKTDLKVVRLFNVYGEERDAVIARSKIVLNLHYYPGGIFEIFRVSHLLANRKCVVSEDGGSDLLLESLAKCTTAYVSRDKIIDTCRELIADTSKRKGLEEKGFSEFSQIDFVKIVKEALEVS